MFTDKLKRYFSKDFKLPIPVFEEEYFNYYLKILDPYYNSLEAHSYFKEMVQELKKDNSNVEEAFFNSNRKVIDSLTNTIKSTEAYNSFLELDMQNFNTKINVGSNNNLYTQNYVNKSFYSIDLKKANYQSLKYINPEIVLNTNTFEELISQFSNFDYHKKSKQIRQVIFGNLNPKRQQQIQKHLMNILIDYLETLGLERKHILSCTADEIVFEDSLVNFNVFKAMKERTVLNDIEFHVNRFELKNIEDRNLFYKHDLNKDTIEFKGVPSSQVIECIKKLENKEVLYQDLIFYHEGRLCKYEKTLFS